MAGELPQSPFNPETLLSWGRSFRYSHRVLHQRWPGDNPLLSINKGDLALPIGLRRSYGDSCLNANQTLIATEEMNRLIDFDSQTRVLRCEAGLSLENLLDWALPKGFFLPVTPGTKFVTVAGAIANDVHGKNHHRAATFGNHVQAFEILRSDSGRMTCSRNQNADLFHATLGGLGLTGLITSVDLTLKPVAGPWIDAELIRMKNLDDFFSISDASDHSHEYTVAWLDCLASGNSLGRGIFIRGNHSSTTDHKIQTRKSSLKMPFDFPNGFLNTPFVKLFNFFYYRKFLGDKKIFRSHYNPFFYPLDSVSDWNRAYGKRGFFQYQCVIPSQRRDALCELLDRISHSGQGSFLSVLKKFGSRQSEGLLSFPQPGYTLALDFANRGASTETLFQKLDEIVAQAGGRLYPAKDSHMDGAFFRASYPQWEKLETRRDPQFSSSFWRRVTHTQNGNLKPKDEKR